MATMSSHLDKADASLASETVGLVLTVILLLIILCAVLIYIIHLARVHEVETVCHGMLPQPPTEPPSSVVVLMDPNEEFVVSARPSSAVKALRRVPAFRRHSSAHPHRRTHSRETIVMGKRRHNSTGSRSLSREQLELSRKWVKAVVKPKSPPSPKSDRRRRESAEDLCSDA